MLTRLLTAFAFGRLSDFVLSNCSWKHGELLATFRRPFDIIAGAAANDRAFVGANGPDLGSSDGWLPTGTCSGRNVSDVVIDLAVARKRFRPGERIWGPPPVQKTLALAEEFRRQLNGKGVIQSGLANLHGLTRARVTQILNLLKLHPAILDFLRLLPAGPDAPLYTERRLRPLLALDPIAQLDKASKSLRGFGPENVRRWSE